MTFNLILKPVVKIHKNAKFLEIPIIEKCVEKALLLTNGLIMVNVTVSLVSKSLVTKYNRTDIVP